MKNDQVSRYYLPLLLLTSLVLGVIILSLMHFFSSQLPAPRLSSSEAFNEKARWLRETSTGCDILIIGSSIALNNIDGEYIHKTTGNLTANLSSFGLNPSEVANQLQTLPKSCEPNLVIYIFFRNDLISRWDKTIDWDAYSKYLAGEPNYRAYARNMDLSYYVSTGIKRTVHKKSGNQSFQSLNFDSTGSVLLSSINFKYDKMRWI